LWKRSLTRPRSGFRTVYAALSPQAGRGNRSKCQRQHTWLWNLDTSRRACGRDGATNALDPILQIRLFGKLEPTKCARAKGTCRAFLCPRGRVLFFVVINKLTSFGLGRIGHSGLCKEPRRDARTLREVHGSAAAREPVCCCRIEFSMSSSRAAETPPRHLVRTAGLRDINLKYFIELNNSKACVPFVWRLSVRNSCEFRSFPFKT
jgi:hypothetical protein